MDKLNKKLYFAKSFLMLGDAKEHCYNCSYCRVKLDDLQSYHMLPSEVNERFRQVPVAVNLFYCDPLLQVENTVNILHQLEKDGHKGPVVIVTKGDFSLFPDILFDLDLHIAFSTFGVNSIYDGSTMERFENNLKQIKLRKNNYHYSIEFRPICYGINDSEEIFRKVFALAKEYGLAIGYSGLQGKKESVQYWKENNIEFKPYPGYTFGHKKIISEEKQELLFNLSKEYNVPIFKKTSCLFSYVHNLERDYNAHYYRPNEVGCYDCPMKEKCFALKKKKKERVELPFEFEILEKQDHECILKKTGLCNFPTEDCSHISGQIIKTDEKLTTSDVRLIKWLTGMTVDADFIESPYISDCWQEKKE